MIALCHRSRTETVLNGCYGFRCESDSATGEVTVKLTELLLAELEREAAGTRRALERLPEGHNDWKPHPHSMPLGYLASLVATMPSWVVMMVKQDELDLKSPAAAKFKPLEWSKRGELVAALDAGLCRGARGPAEHD